MAELRRVTGITFIALGIALLVWAMWQVVEGAPVFVNDAFDGPFILRLFGPGTFILIAGLWLATRKASRAHAVEQRVATTAFQYAAQPVAAGSVAGASPMPVVETVSEVWEPCSRCGDGNVTNVESISMCACGNRESVRGSVDVWPVCPRCAQPRSTRSRTGRCAGCGALRRRGGD